MDHAHAPRAHATVRRARTPWGPARLAVAPEGLRVHRLGRLDPETLVALLVVASVVCAVGGALLPEPWGWALYAPSLALLGLALLLVVVTWAVVAAGLLVGAGRLLTATGRRQAADGVRSLPARWRTAADGLVVPVGDLVAPPRVEHDGVRARLHLPLRSGPRAVDAWWWRADDLERVATALDALARAPRR